MSEVGKNNLQKRLNLLLGEVQPGEAIIWQGKPEAWPFVTLGLLHMIFFIPVSFF